MNLTEREFSRRLARQKDLDEIVDWQYESTTLRWGELDNIRYTPDFTVIQSKFSRIDDDYPNLRIIYIEVKGGHIRAKDIQKFKAARNQFTRFEFQLHQKKNGVWTRLF